MAKPGIFIFRPSPSPRLLPFSSGARKGGWQEAFMALKDETAKNVNPVFILISFPAICYTTRISITLLMYLTEVDMQITLPSGVRLRYDDEGTGRPVILLHAFPLSAALWRVQLTSLRDRMRMIAPDLRGFGGSGGNPPAQSLDDYASDVLELLDALGLDQVVLAGLSMGGYIAFALLRRAPERISGLLLADTRATADSDEVRATRAANAELVLREGSAALASRVLPNLVAPQASEALRAELLQIAAANPPEGIAAALHAMAARPDSTSLLANIRVPTTVVVGAEDALTPPAEARTMHEAIPESRFVVIPGAGHLSAIERPAEFNLALVELVMKVDALQQQ